MTVNPSTGTLPVGHFVGNLTGGTVKRRAGSYSWEITVGLGPSGEVGFHGVTRTGQAAQAPDPSGGTTVDAEARGD